MYVHRLFNFFCNFHPSGAPLAALVSSLPASIPTRYIQISREKTLELLLHSEFTPDFTRYPVRLQVSKHRFGAKLNLGHQWQRMTNSGPFSDFFSRSPSGLPLLSPCLLLEISDLSLSSFSSVRQHYSALQPVSTISFPLQSRTRFNCNKRISGGGKERKKVWLRITSFVCAYLLHGFSAICWMWLYNLVGLSIKIWNLRSCRCFCNATEVAWGK